MVIEACPEFDLKLLLKETLDEQDLKALEAEV